LKTQAKQARKNKRTFIIEFALQYNVIKEFLPSVYRNAKYLYIHENNLHLYHSI